MTIFEKALSITGGGTRQFLILARHFFHRFFQNDLVDFEDQMKERSIAVVALLAAFFGHFANAILFPYLLIPYDSPLWNDAWIQKTYFLVVFMTVMGFITVLEWDVVFPDSRDYLNLRGLPVKTRTLFLSKSASFLMFIWTFSLGSNILAAFVFPYYLAEFKSGNLLYFASLYAGHLAAVVLAGLFVFLAVVDVQGILMTILPAGLYRHVSMITRFLLLVGFLGLIMSHLAGSFGMGLSEGIAWVTAMKKPGAAGVAAFPPLWFTGLSEVISGNKDPFFLAQARAGVAWIVVGLGLFALTFSAGYSRQIRKSLEVKTRRDLLGSLKRAAAAVFNAAVLRNPTQRAVFSFFGKTFLRSNRHKVRLASSMAFAIAMTMILLASSGFGRRTFDPSSRNVMAVPLILSFFLLAGVRLFINVPVVAGANWIFRITEDRFTRNYFIGVKKAVVACALLPMHAALLFFYVPMWGWKDAGHHLTYCFLFSVLLMEILFFKHAKIPFACTFVPGKGKAHYLWLVYALAFYAYASFLTVVEKGLMRKPAEFRAFCGFLLGLIAVAETANILHFYKRITIIYEDKPEPVMVTL
jgi:hypothetical protein